MIPANARLLTCPHCGKKKEVLSLTSGNTCGQIVWSDNKSIAPMLPRVSFVQKCPKCGKYYTLSNQKYEQGDDWSFETGDLNYFELKEAWQQMKDSKLSINEKLTFLLMQVWGFNDEYTRDKETEIPEEDRTYLEDVVNQLLVLDGMDDLLKAELLRETGRFDEALVLLKSYVPGNDFLAQLKEKFTASAEARETKPIIIVGENYRR